MTGDPALLGRMELFEGLDEAGRRAVLQAGAMRRLAQGASAFRQGDPGLTCHVLLEGRVKIVETRPDGSSGLIRYIGPGEMFGAVAALMGRPFPAEAVAVLDSQEIYWPTPVFRELMARHPPLALRCTALAGERLMEMQDRVGELSSARVEQRIARALVRLIEKAGQETPDGVEIGFPITRQELAEIAGSTLHTVSRTLSAWDDQEITSSSRRHIVVKRPEALAGLAEPGG